MLKIDLSTIGNTGTIIVKELPNIICLPDYSLIVVAIKKHSMK
jgi:hypothetical protein